METEALKTSKCFDIPHNIVEKIQNEQLIKDLQKMGQQKSKGQEGRSTA